MVYARTKDDRRQQFHPLTHTVQGKHCTLAASLDSQNPGTRSEIPVCLETPEHMVLKTMYFPATSLFGAPSRPKNNLQLSGQNIEAPKRET